MGLTDQIIKALIAEAKIVAKTPIARVSQYFLTKVSKRK